MRELLRNLKSSIEQEHEDKAQREADSQRLAEQIRGFEEQTKIFQGACAHLFIIQAEQGNVTTFNEKFVEKSLRDWQSPYEWLKEKPVGTKVTNEWFRFKSGEVEHEQLVAPILLPGDAGDLDATLQIHRYRPLRRREQGTVLPDQRQAIYAAEISMSGGNVKQSENLAVSYDFSRRHSQQPVYSVDGLEIDSFCFTVASHKVPAQNASQRLAQFTEVLDLALGQ